MKEARIVPFMRNLDTRKKAPQTMKTELKQGVNRIKRQISLPNANRLKNRCLHGRKQIQPQSWTHLRKSKIKIIIRTEKLHTYANKNQEHPKLQEYSAICGNGTHTVHLKISRHYISRIIKKIGLKSAVQSAKSAGNPPEP